MIISTPELKKRVVIISQADKLNIESQNALLKLLEEPREDVLFILETHTLEPLISTIKSRCWIINFNPLNPEEVQNYLNQKFKDQIEQSLISRVISKFNGENLSELIEILYEFIDLKKSEEVIDLNDDTYKINFIELFRYLYLSNFYKSINYLDQFNILVDRREAINFLNELLKFCYLVLKTKISEENKETDLIRLSKVIDEIKFQKVINYLANSQQYVENYINLNLIFIKLFFLIKNSFIKN